MEIDDNIIIKLVGKVEKTTEAVETLKNEVMLMRDDLEEIKDTTTRHKVYFALLGVGVSILIGTVINTFYSQPLIGGAAAVGGMIASIVVIISNFRW